MSSFASVLSRGTPRTIKRNGYVKEVFWTNDFLQSLHKRKLSRIQSHTYEDLIIQHPPVSLFEEPDGKPEVELVQEEEKQTANYIGSPQTVMKPPLASKSQVKQGEKRSPYHEVRHEDLRVAGQ